MQLIDCRVMNLEGSPAIIEAASGIFREIIKESREAEIHLPIVLFSYSRQSDSKISVYLLCVAKSFVGKFFHDFISKWLIPGRHTQIDFFFGINVIAEEISDRSLYLAQASLSFESKIDCESIFRDREFLTQEIRLGVSSYYYATQLMEIRGVSNKEKATMVQERMLHLISQYPSLFDYDIFSLQQQLFVCMSEEFQNCRLVGHLTRITSMLYLMRSKMSLIEGQNGEKRWILAKVSKFYMHDPLGRTPVLGVYIGVSYLREYEVLTDRHIVKAIARILPGIKLVQDTLLIPDKNESCSHFMYLEISKESKELFSSIEISLLRQELSHNIESAIEHFVRPVFMPRNEEEVMRNMITLVHQLRYVRDIPQVIISFDEQTDRNLIFTVIVARVLRNNYASVIELFRQKEKHQNIQIDRVRKMGLVRNRYAKEATVFRVTMDYSPFLREDDSLDLYEARGCILMDLEEVLGEVRDYNGGMFAKQKEVLDRSRQMLQDKIDIDFSYIERLFYSINPIEMRSVLAPEVFVLLYEQMFVLQKRILNAVNSQYEYVFVSQEERLIIGIFLKENVSQRYALQKIHNVIGELGKIVQAKMRFPEGLFVGYILPLFTIDQQQFKLSIEATLDF